MINMKCADDCKADLVLFEENRPIICWNCGRKWVFEKGTAITPEPNKDVTYDKLPEKREGFDVINIGSVVIEPAPIKEI